MEITSLSMVHHGQNIKRLRDILGIKQDKIAVELNISQQAMSKLEQKEQIDDRTLEKIAEILHIPVEAIKNFNDETTINIVLNNINEFHKNSSFFGYKPTFNPIERVIELYECLLKAEREKNALLEQIIAGKSGK